MEIINDSIYIYTYTEISVWIAQRQSSEFGTHLNSLPNQIYDILLFCSGKERERKNEGLRGREHTES